MLVIAFIHFHRQGRKIKKIKVVEDRDRTRTKAEQIIGLARSAESSLSIADHRSGIDAGIYDNHEVAAALEAKLEEKPGFRINIATAAKRRNHLIGGLRGRPGCITAMGGVRPAGRAFTVSADGGERAYIVDSFGRGRLYDGSETDRETRITAMGGHAEACEALFEELINAEHEAEERLWTTAIRVGGRHRKRTEAEKARPAPETQ